MQSYKLRRLYDEITKINSQMRLFHLLRMLNNLASQHSLVFLSQKLQTFFFFNHSESIFSTYDNCKYTKEKRKTLSSAGSVLTVSIHGQTSFVYVDIYFIY